MVDEPPAEVWSHPGLTSLRSPISGNGLFAETDLSEGSFVFRLGGRLVTAAELDFLIADENAQGRYVDTITVSDGQHLVLPPATLVHFANHCCDPNLWHAGPYDIVARRDIRAGEELTIDYGTHSGAPGFEMGCTCGAPNCRGVVTSEDWRIVELQRRYEGHWTPALARRIEEANAIDREM